MPITEVVFDPRIDLPNGSLGVQAVTVRATPTRIRESGPSTVYPQTVTFANITASTPLRFQSTDGTWAWTIGVYLRSKLLDVRTVFVTGDTATWSALVDVDPSIFETAPTATVSDLIAALQAQIDELRALLGGVSDNVSFIDTGDGFFTIAGNGVTDTLDGYLTMTGNNVTDTGDGYYTIAA